MMTFADRIDVYLAQTHRSTLTPRQSRRAIRKALRARNRAIDSAVADLLTAEAVEAVEALQVDACPTCNASGDERCVTASGKATKNHAKRQTLTSV